MATIRERRNSFVPINRIPLEILSLIPAHLSSQADRLRATFVCRHWRRTFLEHPALWSEVYLRKGEVYAKTLLERAKGSTLDIVSCFSAPIRIITLLPPYTKQIRSLDFDRTLWADIRRFSELNSGPLPLLPVLRINAIGKIDSDSLSTMISPSIPFFSNAVNLQAFQLHSEGSQTLNLFVFPSLTSFELTMESSEEFWASYLLDFLEASPMLQVVHVKIIGDMSLDGIPQERVVVLPDVESLSLAMSYGEPGYEFVAHIS